MAEFPYPEGIPVPHSGDVRLPVPPPHIYSSRETVFLRVRIPKDTPVQKQQTERFSLREEQNLYKNKTCSLLQ